MGFSSMSLCDGGLNLDQQGKCFKFILFFLSYIHVKEEAPCASNEYLEA